MKKIIKTVLISLLCLVLAAVIVLVGNTFLFYPYYSNNKQAVEIQVENNGQIKMMSYNLRCISPTDWGKKAWFYRANLVIDDIENEKPGIIGLQESTKWHY